MVGDGATVSKWRNGVAAYHRYNRHHRLSRQA